MSRKKVETEPNPLCEHVCEVNVEAIQSSHTATDIRAADLARVRRADGEDNTAGYAANDSTNDEDWEVRGACLHCRANEGEDARELDRSEATEFVGEVVVQE